MKIFVKVKPRAKEEKVEKVEDTHFIISVKEPPEKGKANQAVIKVLAEYFNVKKSDIKIVSGLTSHQKL